MVPYIRKNWVDRFFMRHPTIDIKLSRVIDSIRKYYIMKESLMGSYNGLDWVYKWKKIKRKNKYNIDEIGIQLGETNSGIVAGTVLTTILERIKSDNSIWASVLESISAEGRRLTPCVVFSGENKIFILLSSEA
jgi:hypothetical protein